jgi:DNA-3-methyladenine glycosylase
MDISKKIPDGFRVVKRTFFERDTAEVSRELLGKYLGRFFNGSLIGGMIVETEAYYGPDDPASHAYRGQTRRNEVMFGPGGYSYVYFTYGNHYLLNVVTGNKGAPGAVLLRGVEPVFGRGHMEKNRPNKKERELTNGPGKLTQAMGINKEHNGVVMEGPELVIFESNTAPNNEYKIKASSRIGISRGKELKLRFYFGGNRYVSASPKN